MADKVDLSWKDVTQLALNIRAAVTYNTMLTDYIVFGIPRGGIYPAMMIAGLLLHENYVSITDDPARANIFIDDIIDSGETKRRYEKQFPNVPFYALINKRDEKWNGKWISFPWERMSNDDGPVENVRRLIEYIGDDPNREGLRETPQRVIRSYETIFGGYKQQAEDIIKIFEDGACDELVILKDIYFYSTCEHHLLPFSGKAHIGYIPDKRVIGISKLARILEMYTRRLQIQERIGQQVTETLMTLLKPKGAACVLEATHGCMTCRGVQKQGSVMVTSSLRGVFLDQVQTRNEFLSMIRKG
ncbi:MAG: GTP cyclohydrolase I FolE [Candidatus Peribacteraceae bacterium]|nr:GTP cyclohydrolase I FolE [Candidatus Peribacteraceae bacterium]